MLGYFGIHNFYLGFQRKGIIEIILTLLFVGGVGSALFFTNVLPNALAFLFPFLFCWLVAAVCSITYYKKENLKDGHGEFLR